MRYYPILLCFIVCSCDKNSQEEREQSIAAHQYEIDAQGERQKSVSVGAYEFLAPEDLNIEKQRFTARPNKNQVAIFRSSHRSAIDPHDHLTYDQILWTGGDEAHKDVIIADRTFYVDFPQPDPLTGENIFRRSWRLWAGGYSYDINDYGFVRSSWDSSDTEATGEIVYTKKTSSKTEDLVFNFRMFIVSLEEAKTLHPELNIERKEGTISWEAAYHVDETTEQGVGGQPAPPLSESE